MPPCSHATSSPKKVKAKRKVVESDITVVTGQGKKARAADKAGLVSLQLTSDVNASPICRSGHPGAGAGGRNAQLEKVGAVLEAPTISDGTGSAVASSRQKGKKAKTSSAPYSQVEPYSFIHEGVTHEPSHALLQLSLSLCETGARFGFQIPQGNPPIVQPGTEPDLQAINNPYMTMTKKDAENRARSAAQSLTGGRLLSHPLSSARVVSTFSEEHLDPSLRTASYEHRTNISSQHPNSKDSDNSSSDESRASGKDSDDSADIDNSGEREFGWAEVGRRHSVHPVVTLITFQVFLREPEPSPVHATSILTPDFEFQYSHDDDDMNAKQALAFDNPLSSESAFEAAQHVPGSHVRHQSVDVSQGIQETDGSQSAGVADDVLSQHHKTNGRPHLPDPASLELLHHMARKKDLMNNEDLVDMQQSAKGRHGPKPTQLSFYPAHWKNFLEDAKGACCAQHALENLFPALVKDSPGSVAEALLAVLVQWDEAGKQFEPGKL
ncbi:hypothetical protein DFJ58DRAFT_846771 [Suillus subalutaceus]|uniref:uncharacterized protein n=1 Tax=Suillus subalutaceus TaxID=48586 RepID=UPI001B872A0F|nr:uncharacterized protein DFJ58DRAFT_846771 [Suillus subalutaceus]KAG1836787.1 hypothetical protein DFJ58DRAFT_846771 [Suillus subalutaceus]